MMPPKLLIKPPWMSSALEEKTANQITRSHGMVELHVIDLMNLGADAPLIARTANVVTSRLEVPLSS